MSGVRTVVGALRSGLERVHGRPLRFPDPARNHDGARDALRAYVGHEPHDDLVAWFEEAGYDGDIAPGLTLVAWDRLLPGWQQRCTWPIDDPYELLIDGSVVVEGSGRSLDVCPIVHSITSSQVVCTPTRAGGPPPRVVFIGNDDAYFDYTTPGSDVDRTASSHEELPTLQEWAHGIAVDLKNGRYISAGPDYHDLKRNDN